jgi:hypothetical protein
MLAGAALCLFTVSVAILLQLIPEPRAERDYLIIGSVATLLTLLAVFALLLATSLRAEDVFFKKRKKE